MISFLGEKWNAKSWAGSIDLNLHCRSILVDMFACGKGCVNVVKEFLFSWDIVALESYTSSCY